MPPNPNTSVDVPHMSSFSSTTLGVLNGEEVGNTPPHPSNSPSPTELRGVDECGLYNITHINPNVGPLETLGITRTNRPTNPAFASLEDRLKSYDTWPTALQPRPMALATAGFFYTGQSDRCECFQCGGTLHGWSSSDEPWVEHAKFFPLCIYVIHNKGEEFINTCRAVAAPNTSFESFSTQSSDLQSTSEDTSSPEASFSETEAGSSEKSEEEENLADPEICTTKAINEKNEALLCKICYEKQISVAFLPCGHLFACAECAPSLQHCALCRKRVSATVRVYIA